MNVTVIFRKENIFVNYSGGTWKNFQTDTIPFLYASLMTLCIYMENSPNCIRSNWMMMIWLWQQASNIHTWIYHCEFKTMMYKRCSQLVSSPSCTFNTWDMLSPKLIFVKWEAQHEWKTALRWLLARGVRHLFVKLFFYLCALTWKKRQITTNKFAWEQARENVKKKLFQRTFLLIKILFEQFYIMTWLWMEHVNGRREKSQA